jgi:ATP-dependent RNA helicase DDX42
MSDDDFFDDDGDDNDNSVAVASTTSVTVNNNNDNNYKRKTTAETTEDEIDPLDAFMSTLAADTEPTAKVRRADIEERDDMETFLDAHALAKSRAATATTNTFDDDNDNDANDKRNSKVIESLPPVNHAAITYAPLRKAFYTESAEVAEWPFADVERERRELHISVSGGDVKARMLKPIAKFDHLPLDRRLAESLVARGFSAPLTIQREALPVAMSGYDMIALAQTGSGKTVAYLLPMFTHILDQPPLARDDTGPIGLVLAPTHELAQQIYDVARDILSVEVNRVSKQRESLLRGLAVTGGAQMYEQKQALKRGVEFVVATPGRMIDMIKSKACACQRISFVVLDEADRMFAMGFEPQIRSIMGQVRPDRQVLLFSATFKKRLEELAADVLSKPVRINVGNKGGPGQRAHCADCRGV